MLQTRHVALCVETTHLVLRARVLGIHHRITNSHTHGLLILARSHCHNLTSQGLLLGTSQKKTTCCFLLRFCTLQKTQHHATQSASPGVSTSIAIAQPSSKFKVSNNQWEHTGKLFLQHQGAPDEKPKRLILGIPVGRPGPQQPWKGNGTKAGNTRGYKKTYVTHDLSPTP